MKEDQAIRNRRWKAQQRGLWHVRDTRGQVRCQRCYSPALGEPLVPTELLADGVGFSIAATKQPEAANGPSGSDQAAFLAFRKSRNSLASPADTEPIRPS